MVGESFSEQIECYVAMGSTLENMQAQGKAAASEAVRYLFGAIGMSTINRHHHDRAIMEMLSRPALAFCLCLFIEPGAMINIRQVPSHHSDSQSES